MSFTLPWTVNKFVSTNINNADSVAGTYTNVSLKVNGKTELSNATTISSLGVGKDTNASYAVDVLGKINASNDISTSGNVIAYGINVSTINTSSDITTTGNISASRITASGITATGDISANSLRSLQIIPRNRPALSTNRYIGATNVTLDWEDPQNIIFNGNGNWTTFLPSVVSGGIARVGSRFTFGVTINWTGIKQISAQSTQYIYDGGSLLNTISVSVTSSTQHYLELLCVNYTPGAVCWTVINRAYQYSLPANVTFNSGITVSSGISASGTQTINFGSNPITCAGTNISGVVKTTGNETIGGQKTFSDTLTTTGGISASGTLTTTGGITATATQTINFGTNAPTMSGSNISGVVKPVGTETVQITPTQTPITIGNYNFATPAQGVNSFTIIPSPYTAINDWTFALISGTAPSVRIGNSFTAYVNSFANLFPEYPLFSQYLSIQNGSVASVFRLTQSLTFATTGSYLLTMFVWGEYNRYSPTQNVSVSCGDNSVLNFSAVEQGWSKIVMRFKIVTAGANTLTINLNSSTVDSGMSISGIQIVKQAGLVVTDGTNPNTQIITPYGTYTNGRIYNTGSISNYGSLDVYGPLGLFLPYSSGSVVLGSSKYGSLNSLDKGRYNTLIGQSVAVNSTTTQALWIDSCVAIGYAALEQAGTSASGIFRCVGIGYQANRWNVNNCSDNVSIGHQTGQALGYGGVSSQRNTSIGTSVLAGAYVSSSDNTCVGYGSMSATNFSNGRFYNSVLGGSSLVNTVSNYNSSLGYGNAPNMINTGSNYNTFIGAQVCPTQTGSVGNVLLNCTFIGSKSDVPIAGSYSNSTCLGYNSRITGDNQIILGTAAETTYAMGGLNIPNSKTLTITGNINANGQTVTPTQVANLNRIYIETDISNNIAFAAPVPGGFSNYVFGFESMNGQLTTGDSNLAFGINSMINLTSGSYNTGISQFSLSALTTGSSNTSCGYNSGKCDTTSSSNSFFGYNAGSQTNVVRNFCSAFGADSGISGTNTSYSTALGYGVICTASNQIKIGRSSETTIFDGPVIFNNTSTMSGASITANTIAGSSIVSASIGQTQVVNGYVNLSSNQTVGGIKTFSSAPVMSGASITSNTMPGSSIANNTITQSKVESGYINLVDDQSFNGLKIFLDPPQLSGESITANTIKPSSIQSIYIDQTATDQNVTIGVPKTNGISNTAVGIGAMNGGNTTGTQNVACGTISMENLTGGQFNSAFGVGSLGALQNGTRNTSCGHSTGNYIVNGISNTLMGAESAGTPFELNRCSTLGAYSGFSSEINDSTAIGYGVICDASNQIRIGRSSETTIFSGQVIMSNAPTMSGGNISAASIPDTALSANVPLENATNIFTGLNAINNQYVHAGYNGLISSTGSLTTLSAVIYECYSISTTSNITITLPAVTSANVGRSIIFRRVGGTVTTTIGFAINGVQLVYNTALAGSTTNVLMGSGVYTVRLVGLLVTGTTYAWFQV